MPASETTSRRSSRQPPPHPALRHAVVLGGGFAGLLAARVLGDHFRQVTVLDRDQPPRGDEPRRGAPQGHHVHLLLRAGLLAVDELFPDLLDDVRQDPEVPKIDLARDLAWRHLGHWKARFASEYESFPQTRPALEARLRQLVAAMPNVSLRWQTAVEGLLFDAAGERVTGVEVRSAAAGAQQLAADLVVDATGRGSRLPAWLAAAGYAPPREEVQEIGLTYTSAIFRRPRRWFDWQALYLSPRHPAGAGGSRAGALFPIEGERWVATLMGYDGAAAPTDLAGFLDFAGRLASPQLADALEEAELEGEIHRFRIPQQRRRRYEELRRLPGGVLPLGDSLCAFDPVFAQGMTLAAQEALALDRLLAARRPWSHSPTLRLHHAFLHRAARLVDRPWTLATGEALRLPHLAAQRPLAVRLFHRYGERVAAAAGHDRRVNSAFLRVMHLLDGPLSLLRPGLLWRVLRGGRPAPRAGSSEVRTGGPRRPDAQDDARSTPWRPARAS